MAHIAPKGYRYYVVVYGGIDSERGVVSVHGPDPTKILTENHDEPQCSPEPHFVQPACNEHGNAGVGDGQQRIASNRL